MKCKFEGGCAHEGGEDPVSRNPHVLALYSRARQVAGSEVSVLLNGETGSGKEVLASRLHSWSARAEKPFVAVNCAAIPKDLAESLLFGHERGAFTGAVRRSAGVFEAASGGTVFLDEVGDLPAPAQAKLLRVLDSRRFSRVGSCDEIAADVRVISATHRDLAKMASEGTFREDLYYRLKVISLLVTPLRERPEDIGPLACHFLRELEGNRKFRFDAESYALLLKYHWPGNVRELKNAVAHACVFCTDGVVCADDLPEEVRGSVDSFPSSHAAPSDVRPTQSGQPLKRMLATFEMTVLRDALEQAGGNRTEAARSLQIPVRTLAWKMRRHGVTSLLD